MKLVGNIIIATSLLLLQSCSAPEASLTVEKVGAQFFLYADSELIHSTSELIQNPKLITIDGLPLGASWSQVGSNGNSVDYSSTTRDFAWGKAEPMSYRFRFYKGHSPKGARLYPGQERSQDQQLFIIQTKLKVSNSITAWLEAQGLDIVSYIPDNCLLVAAPGSMVAALKGEPVVHRIMPFEPGWKIDPGLPDHFSQRELLVMPTEPGYSAFLAWQLGLKGITVRATSESGLLEVIMDSQQAQEAAQLPSLLRIEANDRTIEYDMDLARIQGGADFLSNVHQVDTLGYTGIGIKGHILEGVEPTHPDLAANEFRDRPIAIDDGTKASHGHRTFGIIFGSGMNNIKATGLLPNGQGYYTNYEALYDSDPDSNDMEGRYELTKRVIKNHGIMFQTASWGYPRTEEYSARSAEMDRIIFDLDIPITQSQSNSGTRLSRPQAWAKNIISVGAVYHFETVEQRDDMWDAGRFTRASTGPAQDGRIKPDLVGYMDSTGTIDINDGYTQFGGTSGATPMVAGHLGLALEMWRNGEFSKDELPASLPHFSTSKALLLHSAKQYSFMSERDDLSRFHQGWGFPDLKRLYNMRSSLHIVDETVALKVHESYQQEFIVSDSNKPFLATLVFPDPPGVVGAEIARVNNLNLKVTSPSGEVYWGNHGLRLTMESQAQGSPDDIDTVERVMIRYPETGIWTVAVEASEINLDGHVETPEIDADFALIVSYDEP